MVRQRLFESQKSTSYRNRKQDHTHSLSRGAHYLNALALTPFANAVPASRLKSRVLRSRTGAGVGEYSYQKHDRRHQEAPHFLSHEHCESPCESRHMRSEAYLGGNRRKDTLRMGRCQLGNYPHNQGGHFDFVGRNTSFHFNEH